MVQYIDTCLLGEFNYTAVDILCNAGIDQHVPAEDNKHGIDTNYRSCSGYSLPGTSGVVQIAGYRC